MLLGQTTTSQMNYLTLYQIKTKTGNRSLMMSIRKEGRGICDDKWSPGHKCDRKRLHILEIHPVEEEPEEFLEALDVEPEQLDEELEEGITIYAVNELPIYNTFKMAARIKGKPILILLDSGSTHNIVSADMVERLQCKTVTVPTFSVSLANGKKVEGTLQCKRNGQVL